MIQEPAHLYLDLLKKSLSFTLWPEPLAPVKLFNFSSLPLKKRLPVSVITNVLKSTPYEVVVDRRITDHQRDEGKFWPVCAHTMIGMKRLDNLQECIETVIRENIEGDLIETGVWRGGACILMRGILAAHGVEGRKVYVADSFEGLPKPDADKYPADKGSPFHTFSSYLAVSKEEVAENFSKYGLLDEQVVFLKGWFKDTLPSAPVEKLAIMRLDGDMYSSTMEALTNLYPKLSEGGFCIIDDYGLINACKRAVDDFRTQQGIVAEIVPIDYSGVYWRK
jgi:O-methyltransferase